MSWSTIWTRCAVASGGPRSLRQHIRQELREHLLDAAEQYRSSGLSQEQAVTKALEDFGGPEQMRAELEATHGHRLMAVVIDKAMQWKERTMKAKWLWTTWAHAALLLVIAAEVTFVAMAMVFVVPKYWHMAADGVFDTDAAGVNAFIGRMNGFLADVAWAINHALWWIIPLAVAWLLFEWRARSENKSMIRLSLMGMLAFLLMGVVMMTAAALILPATLVLPGIEMRRPEQAVETRLAEVDTAVRALEQELVREPKDWDAMHGHMSQLSQALGRLQRMGAAGPILVLRDKPEKAEQVHERLKAARDCMTEVREAIRMKRTPRLEEAVKRFEEAYGPATRPTR